MGKFLVPMLLANSFRVPFSEAKLLLTMATHAGQRYSNGINGLETQQLGLQCLSLSILLCSSPPLFVHRDYGTLCQLILVLSQIFFLDLILDLNNCVS